MSDGSFSQSSSKNSFHLKAQLNDFKIVTVLGIQKRRTYQCLGGVTKGSRRLEDLSQDEGTLTY